MIFETTPIPGALVVSPEPAIDERGLFARTWCAEAFAARGLNAGLAQCATSFNRRRGTLRGLHYQSPPHMEAKLVRCTRGAMFDAIADLRRNSPSFGKWFAVALTESNRKMLYIPEGVAHGFQTLEDETEVFYQISVPYAPASAAGVRWDDPDIGIDWPETPQRIVSERDRNLPLLRDALAFTAPIAA